MKEQHSDSLEPSPFPTTLRQVLHTKLYYFISSHLARPRPVVSTLREMGIVEMDSEISDRIRCIYHLAEGIV